MIPLKNFAILLLLSGCAVAPTANFDYSGLGKSEIAKTLRYSAFTSSVGIDYAVNQVIKKRPISSTFEAQDYLEHLGFDCNKKLEHICDYIGYAKAEMVDQNRSYVERFKLTIHITAEYNDKSIKINSETKRENY